MCLLIIGVDMSKFMLVYKGAATDMSDMPEEKMEQIRLAWEAWMTKLGPAMTDVGTPLGPGASVVDDGSAGTAAELTGYSIIEADDLDAAKSLTKDHPFLSEGKGDYAVDIFELMPVPMGLDE